MKEFAIQAGMVWQVRLATGAVGDCDVQLVDIG